jgi:hypothetical protein
MISTWVLPGGAGGFGVASLRGVEVRAATVSCVADAIGWVTEECKLRDPIAAGIDAMLYGCDGPGGWRPAERSLRAAYPKVLSSVISPNGLYGSMGIGGMALALRLRQRWPNVNLNETHPKVLTFSLRGETHRDNDCAAGITWFEQYSGLDMTRVSGGHEFDAVISAWATREGLSRKWTDLIADDPALLFPVGTVRYLWPELLAAGPTLKRPPATKNWRSAACKSPDDSHRIHKQKHARGGPPN